VCLQAPLQLEGEDQVSQLRLPVGGPALVPALLPVQVVQVDLPDAVRAARQCHHPRRDLGKQQTGEGEVAEEVRADLHLEPVGSPCLRQRHHASVVDQDVDRAAGRRKRAHRGEVGEIEAGDRHVAAHSCRRGLALRHRPACENDPCALRRQGSGGRGTEPTVGSGHDDGASGLVRDVGSGPRHGQKRSQLVA